MRKFLLTLIVSTLAATGAWADMDVAARHVPDADLVGKARLKVLFWKVYDAELYAPNGDWSADEPFALSLNYLRKLEGEQIAKRTIVEMRKQGFEDEVTLARWFDDMRSIIPDVEKNTRITGVADDDQNTLFYSKGKLIGEIKDPLFTQKFFDIWLSEKSSQPKMRNKLLGGTKS